MSTLLLRALEHVHGHLGWLSVVALLHPAIFLRNPKRRAPLSALLSTGLVVVTALLGATIYPAYRDQLKQHIFRDAPKIGWLFERKEHLAVGAVAFALVGCVAHVTLPWVTGDAHAETAQTMARLAHRAFVVAFAFALLVAGLGVAIASYRTF